MAVTARLVGAFDWPLRGEAFGRPALRPAGPQWRAMLVQYGDREAVARLLDPSGAQVEREVRFPSPWPPRYGSAAVAPDAGLAVFAGSHALRAVGPDGAVRWEIRHACWRCRTPVFHSQFAEYAEDADHRYYTGGSVAFSLDGSLVWAHVAGPLAADPDGAPAGEQWIVVDPDSGLLLGRADARSTAIGSHQVPHADAGVMALSIGEGQDGAPLRLGRWDGRRLAVGYLGDDLVLCAISPSGDTVVSVEHGQDRMALHRLVLGGAEVPRLSALGVLDAQGVIPPHPAYDPASDEPDVYWDYYADFVRDDLLIAGTVEWDELWGEGRHWLIDASGGRLKLLDRVAYPVPVHDMPHALGDGTWYTRSKDTGLLQVWTADGV